MGINFISGKPGGGKGLYAMKLIVDELVNGKRPIVTNLAIRLHPWVNAQCTPQLGLLAYLVKLHGETFDAEKRIQILTDEEIKFFYCYRGNGKPVVALEKDNRTGKPLGFSTTADSPLYAGGVLYCLDEAQNYYGARDWAETGKAVIFYASQHRKLGDDVLVVCQKAKQVETQMRMLAQDFTVIRNHSKERFGIFRQPGLFSTATFLDGESAGQEPTHRSAFKLDVLGLAQTYDTTAGVGLMGRSQGDMGKKAKGVHWAFYPAIILSVGLVFILGLRYAAHGAMGLLGGSHTKTTNAVPAVAVAVPVAPVLEPVVQPAAMTPPAAEDEEPRELTGVTVFNGRTTAYFADGESSVLGVDPALSYCGKTYVIYKGKVVKFRKEHPAAKTGTVGAQ